MIPLPGKVSHDKLKVAAIRKGTKFYRVSDPVYPTPLFFNVNQTGRFCSPCGEYGVCYMTDSFDSAFAESIGHSVSDRFEPSQNKIIPESDLVKFHIYQIEAIDTLHVGELCGSGLARLGLDNNINTVPKPYVEPQQWSFWVHQHPKHLDGIRYHSRHLPNIRCEAFFDRSETNFGYVDIGPVINWKCAKTGKDIWDLLFDHGWSVV